MRKNSHGTASPLLSTLYGFQRAILYGFQRAKWVSRLGLPREARNNSSPHPQDWYELCEVGHQLARPQGRVDVGQRVLLLLEGEGVRGRACRL